jgi:hypothetical protein
MSLPREVVQQLLQEPHTMTPREIGSSMTRGRNSK